MTDPAGPKCARCGAPATRHYSEPRWGGYKMRLCEEHYRAMQTERPRYVTREKTQG